MAFIKEACFMGFGGPILGSIFFGAFGVIPWFFDGDATGVLGLGAFGIIFGASLGIGEAVIDHFQHRSISVHAFSSPTCSGQDWIVASVWPKEQATPIDLTTLGQLLGEWRKTHPSVTRIGGLDELLSGRYPPPDGPTPYVEDPEGDPIPYPREDGSEIEWRRMSVSEPWKYCPALVWSTGELSSDEAITSLQEHIPHSVGVVGYSMAGL